MRALGLLPFLALIACDGENTHADTDESDLPEDTSETDIPEDTDADVPDDATYEFVSRFSDDSSVAYDGQTFRHVLILDLKTHLGGLTGRLDSGFFPEEGEVSEELDFYFSFDGDTSGELSHGVVTDPASVQETYNQISSGKDLVGKIAGNDAVGQHEDWTTDFEGWDHPDVTTPESLVRHWFEVIDSQSVDWSNGTYPLDPDGNPVPSVYVTAEGQDLRELIQKFLLGSVAFSQGADDYLDDDEAGKGLLSPNAVAEDGKPFTALEHAWDEGFGYFGAARDFGQWTDAEIASPSYKDSLEPDGNIDLLTEYSFGHSQNAAKRDLGSLSGTDFTADAWEGFVAGRALITEAGGELSEPQLEELKGYRDQAVGAWEMAIAASAVHYINDVLRDMNAFGTEDYVFADHAKHWSELKGFALSLQFNRLSLMSDEEFVELQGYLGVAPVLPNAGEEAKSDYRQALLDARALLGEVYGFDEADLGDDDGENGW